MPLLLHEINDPRTYSRILYLLLALPIGIAEFVFLVTGISFGFGTVITLIGIPVLIGMLFAWRWLASGERWLIEALLGVRIAAPYRTIEKDAALSDALRARIVDPATWKDLVFLILRLPIGIVTFTLSAAVIFWGLGAVLAPAYAWVNDDWTDSISLFDGYPNAFLLVPIGVLVLLAGIPALSALGRLNATFGAQLLGSNEDPELTAEMLDLRDARARVIAAADAERRRLERDLHDGAQQRLVSLALTLRMAEQRATKGDASAAELVRQAGEEANLALRELRDLARGIHPAILTNRGLAAALEDLATRATVPVEIVGAPAQRLPDPVEAAAYFVVSECLANVGKHAQASGATVNVGVVGAMLRVEVVDDGVGGADMNGYGMQGLQDRVGAAGGQLQVASPPGEGTHVTAEIPVDADAASPEPAARTPRVYADEEVERKVSHRRRWLYSRLIVLGSIAALLTGIWALTGAPGSFWFVWPLLGLLLIGGLDAWLVLILEPLRESNLPPELPNRAEAARQLARGRRTWALGGAFAILDLVLIGIWLMSGGDYPWPMWVVLGTAIAFGAKLLSWRLT